MTKFNNTKKWVYAAAMTGVLFAGAQYANSSSNYLAKADTTNNTSQHQYKYNSTINFQDQNKNSLGGVTASSDSNNFQKSRLSYTLHYNNKTYDFTDQIKNDKDIPDTIDLSKSEYNYTLNQPTHTLTVNVIDKDNHAVLATKGYTVTDFGTTDIKDLVEPFSNDYSYSYSDPFNYEDQYNVEVSKANVSSASGTTIHGQASASYDNEGKQSASTTTSSAAASTGTNTNESSTSSESSSAETSSAASSSQSSEASSAESSNASSAESSTQSSAESSKAIQSSENSSEATNSSQAENQSSESTNISSAESSVASAVASSMAEKKSEANKDNEKTSVIYDSVNPGEEKAGNNAGEPAKTEANKLPQTGDKTNQQAIAGVGIIAMIVGAVLGFFGLRRKNR
ncbi:LPXTG cell wall anchor domain-containing protein [Apilactobacillus sp. EABW-1NA]|uniref:LPXTG cell wall anchor domain-containing protein n=1 Tax=Apilactobacillus sp. EABW-1NA TaxID=2984137 RepID=UPI0025AF6628|nr:LPXTG cell wall anchor domain-containing protein [Apilactobacillus sp. EABW-1NA]MDN2613106.1 LPXTG cell wall anchor domain-containing protein [Apilactobacillus sp. EABW-1NA]